jgi:hypothetical protein
MLHKRSPRYRRWFRPKGRGLAAWVGGMDGENAIGHDEHPRSGGGSGMIIPVRGGIATISLPPFDPVFSPSLAET